MTKVVIVLCLFILAVYANTFPGLPGFPDPTNGVHQHEEEIMKKIKGMAQKAYTILKDNKREASFYLMLLNNVGKDIRKIAEHKVDDTLNNVEHEMKILKHKAHGNHHDHCIAIAKGFEKIRTKILNEVDKCVSNNTDEAINLDKKIVRSIGKFLTKNKDILNEAAQCFASDVNQTDGIACLNNALSKALKLSNTQFPELTNTIFQENRHMSTLLHKIVHCDVAKLEVSQLQQLETILIKLKECNNDEPATSTTQRSTPSHSNKPTVTTTVSTSSTTQESSSSSTGGPASSTTQESTSGSTEGPENSTTKSTTSSDCPCATPPTAAPNPTERRRSISYKKYGIKYGINVSVYENR
ncbi:uncharacterized protein [Bombus fervidus]|uniref:uncharacterized protein n=1 Tax=Bombus fervidus TaxID=203811 RepID=UPI003D187E95